MPTTDLVSILLRRDFGDGQYFAKRVERKIFQTDVNLVATFDAPSTSQHAMMMQGFKYLHQGRQWKSIAFGDLSGRDILAIVLIHPCKADESVIDLFAKYEHLQNPPLVAE